VVAARDDSTREDAVRVEAALAKAFLMLTSRQPDDAERAILRRMHSGQLEWYRSHAADAATLVAIGGITVEAARGLAAAGADFLAVSAGVWSHPGGEAQAVRDLNVAIGEGLADRSASGGA
jgi:thiamine monophosphate synthase